MATGRVKGLTIEIGGDTTKLDKALGGVDKNLVTIQKDLQAVERRLKLDPGNTELLAQKQLLLADAVSETAKRMNALDSAAEGVQKAFSNVEIDDKQLRNFYLELELTESDLKSAERALDSFNDELKQTDSPAGDAADAIKDVGDAAGDAGGSMGGLGEFAKGAADGLGLTQIAGAGVAFTIGQKLVEAAIGAAKAIWELDETTKEYRENLGKLNSAAESAGFGTDKAKEKYKEFFSILGDSDTATEATQLLLNMENREEELSQLTALLSNRFVQLGNDIPIDELLQSINLAAQTGEVSGALAATLDQAGTSSVLFGEKLKKMFSGNQEAYEKLKENGPVVNSLTAVTNELSNALLGAGHESDEASKLFYQLAINQKEVATWGEIAAGVYATFGDALPINGLIEAANETAKVGKVTGVLADALNWAGISEDNFNADLEKIISSTDRANYITATLAHTYDEASDAFKRNNEQLIASRDVQASVDDALAEIGESVSNLKTSLLEAFGPEMIEAAKELASAINNIAEAIKAVGDWLDQSEKESGWLFDLLEQFGGNVAKSRLPFLSNFGFLSKSGTSEETVHPYSLAAITAQDLPHLARGTVTRPNNPFLAVVGDNPTEQEIIAPLSTIRQAVGEAMSANGGGGFGPITIPITLELDGTILARKMYTYNAGETARRGPQAVT